MEDKEDNDVQEPGGENITAVKGKAIEIEGMHSYEYLIERNFTYHPPKPGQPELYTKLRNAAKDFAFLINKAVPLSREKELAMTHLEAAVMWANAGIARNG